MAAEDAGQGNGRMMPAAALDELRGERFHACLDNMRDCFAMLTSVRDAAGRIIDFRCDYINPAGCRTNQRPVEDHLGRTLLEVFPDLRKCDLFDACCKVVETGEPLERESVEYADQSGPHDVACAFDIRAWKLDEDALAVTWRDITPQKRAEEELRRANNVKDQFIAALSHELRTPLTPVLAAAGMLLTNPRLPAGLREDAEMIQRNVEIEVALISDLLDVTRIASGKLVLDNRPLDLAAVIRDAATMCAADLQARGQRLVFDMPAEPCPLLGDWARLHQVMWNLLRNAIKFSPRGAAIAVRVARDDGSVTVSVSDPGIGIEPAVLPKVFAPFEQGGIDVTRRFGGLGLGLTICKTIVEAHGGIIRAHSGGLGKGATFTVMLPIRTDGGQPAIYGADPAFNGHSATPLGILLVEDHSDTARILARLLAAEGHDVRICGTVAAALDAARTKVFDVLLCDLELPDGSGHDLLRDIQAAGRSVRAIAISGHGADGDVQRSLRAGFLEHMVKPIQFQSLRRALARAMDLA